MDASVSPVTSTASASPSSEPSPAPLPSPTPSASAAARAPTPEEYARYLARLSAGRKATLAKRWESAIEAFDDALVAKPGDLRALAERGYARLLSGDETRALVDLDAALDGPADSKLRAQIHFNRGLAYEKLGDEPRARQAFAASVAHAPTDAAKNKLDRLNQAEPGKKACFVDLESEARTALVLPDWRAVHSLVVGKPAASEAEAKAWFHPDEPVLVLEAQGDLVAIVAREKGDIMVVRNVSPPLFNGFKCPRFPEVTGTIEHGFLHLKAVEELCETVPHAGGLINWTSKTNGSKRTDHVWDLASAVHVVSVVRGSFDWLTIVDDQVNVGADLDQCSETFPRPKW